MILSLLTSSLRANDIDQHSIKLFPGDTAPWYGILMSEQRYREYRSLRKEAAHTDNLLIEQNFEIRELQKKLDGKSGMSGIEIFCWGLVLGALAGYASDR